MAAVHFDNEISRYLKTPALEHGHWYTDDGLLFIMPNPLYGLCDSVGPDDANEETLNSLYGENGFDRIDPNEVARNLGLNIIHDWQKRFDPGVGYFHV
ncbi:hypothetical protein [Cupriavidus sp. TMH.W2]|uniref:hypothetical protein n=1 Tax=Cupriavidus sp. TMH.W2 TaxID=3434465 RepID=UPI003D778C90